MRLLADENFPKPIVDAPWSEGHDVVWARTDLAGWKDVLLLDLAETEGRILVTLDKDFWQIAVQRATPLEQSGVVLFRIHPATAKRIGPLVRARLALSRRTELRWSQPVGSKVGGTHGRDHPETLRDRLAPTLRGPR